MEVKMLAKEDVFSELNEFLNGYAESVARIYGAALPVPSDLDPTQSRLWATLEMAYAFGIEGTVAPQDFNLSLADGALNPDVSDADSLFHGLSSLEMQTVMAEDAVRFPSKCAKVINTAIARHILHGGERDLVWEADLPSSEYLTIGEVALLANMDERSVRNAATKGAGEGRLITDQIGKRSLVEIAAAQSWLNARKGFVPTLIGSAKRRAPMLSPQTMQALALEADAAGLGLDDFVRQRLLSA